MLTKITKNERPESYGPPEIDTSEITLDDFIGEGTYGKVYKGRCRGTLVAVKVPRQQSLTEKEIQDFKKEVAIMSQIFHPNVVLFMGACTHPGDIKIVTEKMDTNLDTFLHSNPKAKTLSPYKRMIMAKGAAQGMSWLHGISNIIHRDLKPANLLIDKNYNVKVTDFGFSMILKGNNTLKETGAMKGSALWMAPELLKNEEYDKSADVYAFGVVLWEIYTLNEPWEGFNTWKELFEAVVVRNERPQLEPSCPSSLQDLISSCWAFSRTDRLLFPEIVHRLDKVLIQLGIKDELGQCFWEEFFLVQELVESITWKEFRLALSDATGLERTDFDFLAPFIVDQNNNVTIESFNHVLNWFGNGFLQEPESVTIDALNQIKHLTDQRWFHGNITQEVSSAKLSSQRDGTYLVRLSKTLPEFPFTLSLISANRVRDIRIKKQIDGDGNSFFIAHDISAPTVIDLVMSLIEPLGLKMPCPQTSTAGNGYELV